MSEVSQQTVDRVATRAIEIRRLVIEMCAQRGQGYAGQGMQLADILACMFHRELRNPGTADKDRDRFVLSTGHSAIALYAALGTVGVYEHAQLMTYGASLSEIEESPLEGAPGFEITGGSLGQGLSQALGLALAARIRNIDQRTYCVLSDGELQEGQVWEALMAAAHLRVGNLVAIIDNNGEQADGVTADILNVEPIVDKLRGFGIHAQRVDGHDHGEILSALDRARETVEPSAIVCDTIPGKGSQTLEGHPKVHYLRLRPEVWEQALAELDA